MIISKSHKKYRTIATRKTHPFFRFDLCNLLLITGYNVPLMSVDFPEPETPVIRTNCPSGIFILIFFKLLPFAPVNKILLP